MKYLEEQIDKTIAKLSRINWLTVIAMILLLLTTSLLQKKFGTTPTPEHSAILYVVAIAVGIIVIPLSGWYFSKSIKKIDTKNPLEINLRIYSVSFGYKLIFINIGFIANLFLLYFSGNTNLLIIGAIYIVYQMIMLQSRDFIFQVMGVEITPANETELPIEDSKPQEK